MKRLVLILISGFLLGACGNTSADDSDELRISAASSLTEAMQAIETEFQNEHPDIQLSFNYGSSGKLRNQIQQGAPTDLFLSASSKDMDLLADEKLVERKSIKNFAQNNLVLATAEKSDGGSLMDLLDGSGELIAVGEPESVPVGIYTKEALQSLKVWNKIENRLIFAKDARQVLSYIASGNAEMGFVYASDAHITPEIKTFIELPESGQEILYPAGIISDSQRKQEAQVFLNYLVSDEGQLLLSEYGFTPAKGELR